MEPRDDDRLMRPRRGEDKGQLKKETKAKCYSKDIDGNNTDTDICGEYIERIGHVR